MSNRDYLERQRTAPRTDEIRRLVAPILGDTDSILATTVTLRKHGVFVYACKANTGPDCYGEIPIDPNWRFLILPEGSKLESAAIEELGEKTVITLPDGFQFIYDLPTTKRKKRENVYVSDPSVALIENELEKQQRELKRCYKS